MKGNIKSLLKVIFFSILLLIMSLSVSNYCVLAADNEGNEENGGMLNDLLNIIEGAKAGSAVLVQISENEDENYDIYFDNITTKTDKDVAGTVKLSKNGETITEGDMHLFKQNEGYVLDYVDQDGNKKTLTTKVTLVNKDEDEYEKIKAESIKIIEDYKATATEEELNNKNTNAEQKKTVVEAYNKLKDEDKAPYTEFINKILAGGSPVITVVANNLTYKQGANIDLYSLITISDNEDGEITSNENNVKVTTDLDTNKVGIYDVTYEVTDKDGNKSTRVIQIIIEEDTAPRFEVVLKTSKEILNPGDEFEIIVNVCNIKNVEKGLIAIAGKLNYDTDLFEIISFNGENEWKFDEGSFNEEKLKFVTDNNSLLLTNEDILKFNMKVKENVAEAKFGETLFELKELEASNGESVIKASDSKLTLHIEKETEGLKISSNKYKIKDDMILHVLPKTTVSEFNKNITANRTKHVVDENGVEQKEQDMVKTGMKLKFDGENIEYTIVVLGDINRNGVIDITDISRIKLHIVEKRFLTGIDLIAADTDKDEKAGIIDLSLMKLVLVGLRELE